MRRLACVAASALAAGCGSSPLLNGAIYSEGADHAVLCAGNIDDKNFVDDETLAWALDEVVDHARVLHIYAHRPGDTIDPGRIEDVLAGGAGRGIPFVTYADLLAGAQGPAIALGFDDHNLAEWTATRPLFDRFGAKVTLFISRYHSSDDTQRAQLVELAADGHDIEYHSTNHVPAEDYVRDHGLAAYLADEIEPDLALMRADGYDPKVFAYPFGSRTAAIDAALEPLFPLLRTSGFSCPH